MATDKEVNARLVRVYNITLVEYEVMLQDQDGCCAICYKEPTGKRLHVDHDHKFVRKRITASKLPSGKWTASTSLLDPPHFEATGHTRSEAKKAVKRLLTRNANRGLLCWACNSGLAKWRDNPTLMEAAARYITKFNLKLQGATNGK
jgi:hypothetical protein